ncbi:hypothetical protein GQ457_12G007090 [Hibiscus cannabinus]
MGLKLSGSVLLDRVAVRIRVGSCGSGSGNPSRWGLSTSLLRPPLSDECSGEERPPTESPHFHLYVPSLSFSINTLGGHENEPKSTALLVAATIFGGHFRCVRAPDGTLDPLFLLFGLILSKGHRMCPKIGVGYCDSQRSIRRRPPSDLRGSEICGSPLRWPCFDRSDLRRGAPTVLWVCLSLWTVDDAGFELFVALYGERLISYIDALIGVKASIGSSEILRLSTAQTSESEDDFKGIKAFARPNDEKEADFI